MNKSYIVKIYQSDGTYITTVNQKLRLSKINFRSTINSGQGNLSISIKESFDNPPSWAALNNFVKIYCVKLTGKIQSEELLFAGFISQVEHVLKGSDESMTLSVLGLGSLLGLALYKDGSAFEVVKSSVDPSAIATDIISKVNSQIGTSWLSSSSNVDSVGVNVSYTFKKQRWLKAMQTALGFAGGDWFWRIDADGELYFKQIPSSATHKFNILKHINQINVVNNSENVVNDSTIDNGTAYNSTDATSISNYFKRDEWKSDTGLDANASQQLADSNVANKKDPKIQTKVEINSEYDIESIRPGDTCKFFGTSIGSTTLGDNMVIVSVEYNETTANLTLADEFTNFGAELTKYLDGQFLDKQI